ncbi:DUF4251 domain-containing protein [Mucilaginibacter paludis]|uniref:DUF4251 domain-containing protein n=1 Tax=Mucilaginibacter paludis DSM 18603 TaxID=714943 RepID=H1YED2_9SPHI|nr:DUF4251 domain-containing protein [Mucilaginibacter paludis]EHQ27166.1 hypothetical protein Mucpa_3062 [Mucilaginibacter paludis DSM 18603]
MEILVKKWAKQAFLIVLVSFLFNTSFAQTTRKEKSAQKEAEVKGLVESRNYVFKAEFAQPMRGGSRYITPDYDLTVSKDSLVAYLPYFGRAYIAPINPQDGGVMFTTTQFDYNMAEKKNSWEIVFNTRNAKDVQKMYLSVGKDGYATLQITSNSRDPISFRGYVQARKKKA